jgi:hypothetical protein
VSLQLLIVLGILAMAGLAVLRVVRVDRGRTPLPDGRMRLLFLLAFLIVPPVALAAVVQPEMNLNRGVPWIPLYAVVLFGLTAAMWIVAVGVQSLVHGRARPRLLLALVGSEGDPEDVPFDPPLTPRLVQSLARVDRTNDVFPRGHEFAAQVDRAGFRDAWDALDAATRTLETEIAEDLRMRVAVASAARATADDARGRLRTLRQISLDRGGTWAD